MNKIRIWLIKKLGGIVIEPPSCDYLITAVNQRGETVPWTTINPTKRKSKNNIVVYYNIYKGVELLVSLPTGKLKPKCKYCKFERVRGVESGRFHQYHEQQEKEIDFIPTKLK